MELAHFLYVRRWHRIVVTGKCLMCGARGSWFDAKLCHHDFEIGYLLSLCCHMTEMVLKRQKILQTIMLICKLLIFSSENYCYTLCLVGFVILGSVVVYRRKLLPYFSQRLIDSCYLNFVTTGELGCGLTTLVLYQHNSFNIFTGIFNIDHNVSVMRDSFQSLNA